MGYLEILRRREDAGPALKTIRSIEELEMYLAHSADAVEVGTVDFLDLAAANGNYYFRWEMSLRFKKGVSSYLARHFGWEHPRRHRRIACHD